MHLSLGILSILAVIATAGKVIPLTHIVREKRAAPPKHFIKRSRVHPDSILPVRIGLAQNNLERGQDWLADISDPTSPNYGKHWTSEEVIEAFRPTDEIVLEVKQWLESAGFYNITHSDNKGWLAFNAPANQVERLLHAEYHEYEDTVSGVSMPSCDIYHVPAHIQHHIDYITPGLKLLSGANKLRKKRGMVESSPFDHGLTRRSDNSPLFPDGNDLKNCWRYVSPKCLRYLYKIPVGNFTANPNNTFGLYESELGLYDQSSLNEFFTHYAPFIPNGTKPINENIDGGVSEVPRFKKLIKEATGRILHGLLIKDLTGIAAIIDLDATYPIVYPQTITVLNENDLLTQGWKNNTYTWGFNQFLDAIDGSYCTYSAYGETGDLKGIDPTYPMPGVFGWDHPLQCGIFKPTNVVSVSYGGQEVDVPISYQKRQCNEFMKLALQGTTFLIAAGDNGVQYVPSTITHYGQDGPTGCLGNGYKAFNPAWPNTCPYVTNVGGTRIPKGVDIRNTSHPEEVVFQPEFHMYQNFSSGGGFSNIYPMPSWQKTAVEHYLKKYVTYDSYATLAPNVTDPYVHVNVSALQGPGNEGLFNRIGRAYPDVSAISFNEICVSGGSAGVCYGTSVAAPIFAAIINRINEERLAAGKKPVGFINPTIYANPQAFRDITEGHNEGCNTTGFAAAPGWDASSGLGTPIYPKLLDVFMKLP